MRQRQRPWGRLGPPRGGDGRERGGREEGGGERRRREEQRGAACYAAAMYRCVLLRGIRSFARQEPYIRTARPRSCCCELTQRTPGNSRVRGQHLRGAALSERRGEPMAAPARKVYDQTLRSCCSRTRMRTVRRRCRGRARRSRGLSRLIEKCSASSGVGVKTKTAGSAHSQRRKASTLSPLTTCAARKGGIRSHANNPQQHRPSWLCEALTRTPHGIPRPCRTSSHLPSRRSPQPILWRWRTRAARCRRRQRMQAVETRGRPRSSHHHRLHLIPALSTNPRWLRIHLLSGPHRPPSTPSSLPPSPLPPLSPLCPSTRPRPRALWWRNRPRRRCPPSRSAVSRPPRRRPCSTRPRHRPRLSRCPLPLPKRRPR